MGINDAYGLTLFLEGARTKACAKFQTEDPPSEFLHQKDCALQPEIMAWRRLGSVLLYV